MALKRLDNGTFVIMNDKDLEKASQLFAELQGELAALEEEFSIADMQSDTTELQRAVADYCARKGRKDVEFGGDDWTVVQRHSRSWNASKLRSKVSKTLWLRITRQTPDQALIDEAIAEGALHENDIADAFEETPQRPYLKRKTGSARNEEEAAAIAAVTPQRKR